MSHPEPEQHPRHEPEDAPPATAGRAARKIAFFDCFAGISGDMTLGALIDAGVDEDELRRGLESLGLPEWELRTRRVQRHAITATDVEVIDVAHPRQPDGGTSTGGHRHVHSHSFSHSHTHADEPKGAEEHGHSHSHAHAHVHVDAAGQGFVFTHVHTSGHGH